MEKTLPSGFKFPPEILFTPRNGRAYTKEDFEYCMSQQPLGGYDTLPTYLWPSEHTMTRVVPPLMRYGWAVDYVKLFDTFKVRFPNHVHMCRWPQDPLHVEFLKETPYDEEGREHGSDEEIPHEKIEPRFPDYPHTFFANSKLRRAICQEIGVEPASFKLFSIETLADSQGKFCIGVTIGTNFSDVLLESFEEKIQDLLELDGKPKWYLDVERWCWTKASSKADKKQCK